MADRIRTQLKPLQRSTTSQTSHGPAKRKPRNGPVNGRESTLTLRDAQHTKNLRARIGIKTSVQTQCCTGSTPARISIVNLKKSDDHDNSEQNR